MDEGKLPSGVWGQFAAEGGQTLLPQTQAPLEIPHSVSLLTVFPLDRLQPPKAPPSHHLSTINSTTSSNRNSSDSI